MPESSPDVEHWRRAADLADQVRQLEPWHWMSEVDLFGVRTQAMPEPCFVSILGSQGQSYAVIAYQGVTALGQLMYLREANLQHSPDVGMQLLEIPYVSVEFSPRRDLRPDDLALLERLKRTFRGSHAWPRFRATLPGRMPRLPHDDQARLIEAVLGQVLQVAPRFRNQYELLYPEDEKYLIRCESGGWHDVYEDVRPGDLPWENDDIDIFTLNAYRQLPRRSGAVELDFFSTWTLVADEDDDPFFLYVLLLVSADDGIVLGVDTLTPMSGFRSMWRQIPIKLVQLLRRSGGAPFEVRLRSERLLSAVEPALRAAGVDVVVQDELGAADEARASLSQFLDRRSAAARQDAESERDPAAESGERPSSAWPFTPTAADGRSSMSPRETQPDMPPLPEWFDSSRPLDMLSAMLQIDAQADGAPLPLAMSREEYERILAQGQITPAGPGSILRDVEIVLQTAEQGIELTRRERLPVVRFAADVNARLSKPLLVRLRKPLPRSYPNVLGLFHVLINSGLLGLHASREARVDARAREEWESLGPAERYISLLEAWLCGVDPEWKPDNPRILWPVIQWIRFQGLMVRSPRKTLHMGPADLPFVRVHIGLVNCALMESFGLIEIQRDPVAGPRPDSIRALLATPWGAALAGRLLDYVLHEHADRRRAEPAIRDGAQGELIPVLQQYFPQARRRLSTLLPLPDPHQLLEPLFDPFPPG